MLYARFCLNAEGPFPAAEMIFLSFLLASKSLIFINVAVSCQCEFSAQEQD